MKHLVAVLGPTAAGKSGVAEYLAESFGGEILNADASAVYRELSVGVTKPDPDIRTRIPHHLLDLTDLATGFTLMDYLEQAHPVIDEIAGRGALPILVGGSGLYSRAVLDGYVPPQIQVPPAIREEVRNLEPASALEKLLEVDPEAYRRVDRRNPRRVSRALELAIAIGGAVPPPENSPRPDLKILRLYLAPTKEVLDERIRQRTLQMWDLWVKEVDQLEKKGLANWLDVRKPIGYGSVLAYIRGEMSEEQTVDEIVAHTVKLAKKQRTWLKRERSGPDRHWLELNHRDDWSKLPETASQLTRKFLS